MGIASIVHFYVFPAKPYSLLGDRIPGVSVLGDYASVDCPIDPDEVRDSERPTKLKFPLAQDIDAKTGTAIRESVRDVLLGGGGYVSFYVSALVLYLHNILKLYGLYSPCIQWNNLAYFVGWVSDKIMEPFCLHIFRAFGCHCTRVEPMGVPFWAADHTVICS